MRRNAITRLAEQVVGSRRALRALTAAERASVKETARELYDNGVSFSRQDIVEEIDRRGFVYVIAHPAFPNHVKVGRAFDPEDRTSKYQTGCPFRKYTLLHATYFEDAYAAEKEIHARLAPLREQGEWFRLNHKQARQAIRQLREEI